MKLAEIVSIYKRLYNNYIKPHMFRLILALALSVIVALSTSSIAWLLDPAVKKIFIDKDKTYALLIPLAIVVAFSMKGVSLFLARTNVIKVGYWICAELQKQMSEKILLSDMADWNPAEIIGDEPNPLDYSLYEYLIMKDAWAIGRSNLGYSKITSSLMTKFSNKPYVNVGLSFRSLIPNSINNKTKEKLVKFYLDKLRKNGVIG